MRPLQRRVVDAGLAVARAYWRTVNPFRVGVQGVVLDERGCVLLVRHGYGERRWHLPGGGVQRRETAVDGLRREVVEETGLAITAAPEDLHLLGVYANFVEGKSDHTAVFVVGPGGWEGTLDREPGIEVTDVGFFPLDGLPDGTASGTRRRLDEHAGRRPVTFEW